MLSEICWFKKEDNIMKNKITILMLSLFFSTSYAFATEQNINNEDLNKEKVQQSEDKNTFNEQLKHEAKSLGHDTAAVINKGQAKLNESLGDEESAKLNQKEALKHKEASQKEDKKADIYAEENKNKMSDAWEDTKKSSHELWEQTKESTKNEWNKTKESAKSGWEAAKDKYNEEDNKTTIEQKDKK